MYRKSPPVNLSYSSISHAIHLGKLHLPETCLHQVSLLYGCHVVKERPVVTPMLDKMSSPGNVRWPSQSILNVFTYSVSSE